MVQLLWKILAQFSVNFIHQKIFIDVTAMVGGWGYPADVQANTMCSVSTKTDIPLPLPFY